MQGFALRLDELTAYAEIVFVVCLGYFGLCRQGEVAQVGCYESFQSGFSPFVESLKQRYCKCVLHTIVRCLVIDGVARVVACRIECVGIEVFRSFVCLVYASVCVKLHCVYEACHGHIFVLHPHCVLCSFGFKRTQTVCCSLSVYCYSLGRCFC